MAIVAAPVVTLRPYQREAVDAVQSAYERGIQRPLVVLPTGCGKTIVFAELIRRRAALGRALVLAHRDELIRQAADKVRMVIPDAEIGLVKADENNIDAPVVVASVQSLSRPNRLYRLSRNFATVVVDEAHHAVRGNRTYASILERVGSFDGDHEPLTMGVTATPQRLDEEQDKDRQLRSVWQEIVYRKQIIEMIASHYLSDVRAIQVQLEADFNTAWNGRYGDFDDGASGRLLMEANAPKHAVEAYKSHALGRKTIAFVPTVQVAYALADAFNQAGIPAAAIDGKTPMRRREEIERKFRNREILVIANVGVLTEGYDEPDIGCVLVAKPTQSASLYQQMVGRGLRRFPQKQDCLILDLVGASAKHSLMSAAKLFDKDPRKFEKKTLVELESEELLELKPKEESEQVELEEVNGRLTAHEVNPFHDSSLVWVQVSDTHYTLAVEDGLLSLEKGEKGDLWDVYHYKKETREKELVAQGMPLDYAQGMAEDKAREVGAIVTLIDRDAPWRQLPATEKQRALLEQMGIDYDADTLTRGQASELIAQYKAQRLISWSGPATMKQLYKLGKLGIHVDPGITKAEASRLISEALGETEDAAQDKESS